jgi:hypothetical protein
MRNAGRIALHKSKLLAIGSESLLHLSSSISTAYNCKILAFIALCSPDRVHTGNGSRIFTPGK